MFEIPTVARWLAAPAAQARSSCSKPCILDGWTTTTGECLTAIVRNGLGQCRTGFASSSPHTVARWLAALAALTELHRLGGSAGGKAPRRAPSPDCTGFTDCTARSFEGTFFVVSLHVFGFFTARFSWFHCKFFSLHVFRGFTVHFFFSLHICLCFIARFFLTARFWGPRKSENVQ